MLFGAYLVNKHILFETKEIPKNAIYTKFSIFVTLAPNLMIYDSKDAYKRVETMYKKKMKIKANAIIINASEY